MPRGVSMAVHILFPILFSLSLSLSFSRRPKRLTNSRAGRVSFFRNLNRNSKGKKGGPFQGKN